MKASLQNIMTEEQRSLLVQIRSAAARIWETAIHQYFTNHDVKHSERIIEHLNGLTAGVQRTEKALSPTEAFILLAAAYLHDIGMQDQTFAGGDLEEIRKLHHEKSEEMILASFEDPANNFTVSLSQDPVIVESIALVAKGHRKVDLGHSEYDTYRRGSETLRPRLLAALLRFGDELDIDYRRIDIARIALLDIPLDSQLHWWRCHYVSGVEIRDEFIRITYQFPDGCDYERFLVPQIEDEIIQKLESLKPIFRPNLVKVDIGPSVVRTVKRLKQLPPEVLRLARAQKISKPADEISPKAFKPEEMVDWLKQEMGDEYLQEMLGYAKEYEAREFREARPVLQGPPYGRPDIGQLGWAVVFPEKQSQDIKAALEPLLEHRRKQAKSDRTDLFQVMVLKDGETKAQFLARHGAGPGPVDAARCPYYVLIVGSPEEIPFRFQYELGVQYAVGRLCFDDVQSYGNYAETVVRLEQHEEAHLPQRVALFGPRNRDDEPTALSSEFLIKPLARRLTESKPGWDVEEFSGEAASKNNLNELFGGQLSSSLLFTASHGVSLGREHPGQETLQGALVCQDWRGPIETPQGPLSPEDYFSVEDLASSRDLSGMIVFMFSCFSAGTPQVDNFDRNSHARRKTLARRSFLSALPLGLLGNEGGPSLAVVGRVDRAWTTSFRWPADTDDGVSQVEAFEKTLESLLEGNSVGASMQHFSRRAAEISVELSHLIEDREEGRGDEGDHIEFLQRAFKDSRNWIILGDPAVRISARRKKTKKR